MEPGSEPRPGGNPKREPLDAHPAGGGGEPPAGWLVWCGLALVAIAIASNLSSSPWSFFPDQRLRVGALWFFLLAIVAFRPRTPPVALAQTGLLVAGAVLAHQLLSTTGPHLLFSDDHSTFFYRLTILDRHFPDLATYNPGWNAGVLTTDILLTGAVLLYLLAAPLFAFVVPEEGYNLLIAGLFAVILPWSLWASARLLGVGRRTSCAAGYLALGPSLLLYRWGLAYGTSPFVIVSFLTPLVYALAVRTLRADHWLLWGALFGLIVNAIIFWSGSAFLILPMMLLLLAEPTREHALARLSRLVAVAAVVLLLNSWWLVEYFQLIPLARFLSEGSITGAPAPPAHPTGLGAALRTAWGILQKTNPLLLALTLVGLVGARDHATRRLTFLAGGFFLMASIGPQLARHLELDRMALPMSLCLTIPAAGGVRLLWSARSALGRTIGRALVVVVLALTGLSAQTYWANESIERYTVLSPAVEELVMKIREESRGGRTYIAGFVLHDFSDGHAAGLQRLAGVPMVAVEPMHRYWWYREPVPETFRRAGGFSDYLRLLNVDLVVTTRAASQERIASDGAFELLWEAGRYALFRFREFPGDWFLDGSGEVAEVPGGLRVRLDSGEAVLRFAYQPGLEAGDDTRIEPALVGGLPWIRLRAPRDHWVEVRLP